MAVPPSELEVSPVQPEPIFVPNYLSNPDLKKLWDLPDKDDLEPRQPYPSSPIPSGKATLASKSENISLKVECSTISESSAGRDSDVITQGIKEEVLICSDSEKPSDIIGAVYADTTSTLHDLVGQIKKELTEAPTPFKLFKRNKNGQVIPFHAGQFQLPWSNVIRPQAGDLLVLKSASDNV
ncbi:hypothetical protein DSO57_1027082 [Entomophthora muscae]|uniref:Uncharacterized protein n=1 Tax=Entomophthora muscae TaxID=34485 RepID=A0ACC2T1R1_9FUNG|nr:hypothetical protein DSO57_1027082 [Entomophthora muscae]